MSCDFEIRTNHSTVQWTSWRSDSNPIFEISVELTRRDFNLGYADYIFRGEGLELDMLSKNTKHSAS